MKLTILTTFGGLSKCCLQEKDESTDAKGLSKEELGRLVGSRWTGNSEKQTEEVRDTKDNDHGDHEEMAHDTHDEKYDGYASETADETGKDDDVDGEDDVDETYEEEVRDDVDDAPYKSDSDDEVEFSGLQLFVATAFCAQLFLFKELILGTCCQIQPPQVIHLGWRIYSKPLGAFYKPLNYSKLQWINQVNFKTLCYY
jgi:hypothetical protein